VAGTPRSGQELIAISSKRASRQIQVDVAITASDSEVSHAVPRERLTY
jgi:hypothetical protein